MAAEYMIRGEKRKTERQLIRRQRRTLSLFTRNTVGEVTEVGLTLRSGGKEKKPLPPIVWALKRKGTKGRPFSRRWKRSGTLHER